MSDAAPDRSVGAPPPRIRQVEPDLSRLIADRREAASIELPSATTAEEGPQAASTPPTPRKRAVAPKRPASASQPRSAAVEGFVGKNTTYLSDATRNRARAVYRATNDSEGDASWSDFVEKAIAAEAERREALYNGGQQYPASGGRLRPGRPLG